MNYYIVTDFSSGLLSDEAEKKLKRTRDFCRVWKMMIDLWYVVLNIILADQYLLTSFRQANSNSSKPN